MSFEIFDRTLSHDQVISARKGEFETGYERGGQTREHVQLAKTLGVSKLLVVVNKMDDPTVIWSKERCFSLFESVLVHCGGAFICVLCGYNLLAWKHLQCSLCIFWVCSVVVSFSWCFDLFHNVSQV